MTQIRDSIKQLKVLLGDVVRVDRGALSNLDLVSLLEAEEALGRLVDVARVSTAAEVADRSRYELGMAGLSMQHGHAKPVDFIAHRTRVSTSEAGRRIRVGAAIRPRRSLLGEALPADRPILAEAMTAGLVGVDSGQAIISALKQAARGSEATPENMDAAELALVQLATTHVADDVAGLGRKWRDALDPDGIEPRFEQIHEQRGVRVGMERNGLKIYTIIADPPMSAVLDAVLLDSMSPTAGPRFLSDDDRARAKTEIVTIDSIDSDTGTGTTDADAGIAAGTEIERLVDPRSLEQKRADILSGVLATGLAATRDGAPDRRTIGSVTAVIQLKDLIAGTGFGVLEGIDEVIPANVIQQLVCDTGFEPVVVGNLGQPLYLGQPVRYFTRAQKRALVARDGDRCIADGCRKRSAETHGHHVIFHSLGGPTDIDNAVLLCPAHHGALHKGVFEIRMIDGMPWIRSGADAMIDNAWRPASRNRLSFTLAS